VSDPDQDPDHQRMLRLEAAAKSAHTRLDELERAASAQGIPREWRGAGNARPRPKQ
jgi:hypothetical protein